ncbi:MAG: SulP family inorganic anion transporter [Christensenellaceae bacterium]|jgi:SulP family sulfate permease|nr:SulP family inorganic anion transporter [Christensenellaceae bacterium]
MKFELLRSFDGYKLTNLTKDLTAGLMVAIVAMPLSIALGIQSDSTLQAGLITAIVGGFFIAVFGGSRYSIGGPSATFVVVTVSYINNPAIGIPGIVIITMLAGVVLILFGLLRFGKALKFVPYPLVIGFTAGIGVILLVGQIKDFFGLTISGTISADFIPKLMSYFTHLNTFNIVSFVLGIITLAIIYLLPKINRKIPSVIIAIIIVTFISIGIKSILKDNVEIKTIGSTYGEINADINLMFSLNFSEVNFISLIMPIFTIAVLSALEGLMSATVAEGMTNRIYDPNAELIGHGIANIASGFFCGLPVTGALARTSVNITGGAKTPIAGISHSLILLLMFFILMPIMRYIPFCVLSAVLVKVAINMSRFKLVSKFAIFSIRDSIILMTSFLLTIFLGVLYGVTLGLLCAFIANIKNIIRGIKITNVPHKSSENLSYYRLDGALYFVSVVKVIDFVREKMLTTDEIVLDLIDIKTIDATSVERLAKYSKMFKESGKKLSLLNLNSFVRVRYEKAFKTLYFTWR